MQEYDMYTNMYVSIHPSEASSYHNIVYIYIIEDVLNNVICK